MEILLIVICIATVSVQPVFMKDFNIKCKNAQITFSLLTSLFALLFFTITSHGSQYSASVIPYSFLFAVCYAVCTVTSVLALGCGSLAITTLILSYSLVIPTVYSIAFWGEKIGILQLAGIVALMISLYLVRAEKDNRDTKVTWKWVLYVVIGFFTNGGCSVIQRQQQIAFGGKYDMSFMVISLSFVVVMLLAALLIKERGVIKEALKKGLVPSFLCGMCNGATNLLVMLCLATIPASIFFPVLTAGKIVITIFIAIAVFRESFVKRQLAGLLFGMFALILVNL